MPPFVGKDVRQTPPKRGQPVYASDGPEKAPAKALARVPEVIPQAMEMMPPETGAMAIVKDYLKEISNDHDKATAEKWKAQEWEGLAKELAAQLKSYESELDPKVKAFNTKTTDMNDKIGNIIKEYQPALDQLSAEIDEMMKKQSEHFDKLLEEKKGEIEKAKEYGERVDKQTKGKIAEYKEDPISDNMKQLLLAMKAALDGEVTGLSAKEDYTLLAPYKIVAEDTLKAINDKPKSVIIVDKKVLDAYIVLVHIMLVIIAVPILMKSLDQHVSEKKERSPPLAVWLTNNDNHAMYANDAEKSKMLETLMKLLQSKGIELVPLVIACSVDDIHSNGKPIFLFADAGVTVDADMAHVLVFQFTN